MISYGSGPPISMKINFCVPNSTEHANNELKRIYTKAKENIPDAILSSNQMHADHHNITYGYLGLFCRLRHAGLLDRHKFITRNSYIIDHSFSPRELKGQVFRLSKMNKELETMIFHKKLTSAQERDKIYCHLKALAVRKNISLMIPTDHAKLLENKNNQSVSVRLLIKHSPVQSRLKQGTNNLINEWKHKGANKYNQTVNVITFKGSEIKLSPRNAWRGNIHIGRKINMDFGQIEECFCPTSMLGIDFILSGRKVRFSTQHPLYTLLGDFVPCLSKKERIELAMDCIDKISFSANKISLLHEYLDER